MNLKSLIITLSFLLFSISVLGQYNYTQKLGSLATIMLPDTPKLIRLKGTEAYVSNYKGVMFMAQAGDVSGGFQELINKTNIDTIYNNYIGGLLQGTNGKLFYKDKIKMQEREAFEFGYKAKLKGQETYRYNRIIVLNDTILMSCILSSDSLSKNSPALNNFFKGFNIKSDEQIRLSNASNLGRKTGHVIGILILLSIFTAIGLALVFLIRKIAYKNKQ